MLPTIVAEQIKNSLRAFLREQFRMTTPAFHNAQGSLIDRYVDEGDRLLRGPYLDIQLPFQRASGAQELPFRHVKLPYVPYIHQSKAFERLHTANGHVPQSTIVATGTGSGKTECFLYPMLDHCLAHRERGIKAIVIYPMNALADDQAQRFAREIAARGAGVRVGLFTGGTGTETTTMGADHVITNKEVLRSRPPDILLTNYKMLDYLLIRPKDRKLWRYNQPETLRYLVVDELHTFDGAQGTDLACLVRRLRDRLAAHENLACVGTSATMGSGADTRELLQEYAAQVFDAPFDDEAIIGESRVSIAGYLEASAENANNTDGQPEEERSSTRWPTDRLDALRSTGRTKPEYMQALAEAWFKPDAEDEGGDSFDLDFQHEDPAVVRASRVHLAQWVRSHVAFRQLLGRDQKLRPIRDIAGQWTKRMPPPEGEETLTIADATLLVDSFVALIAYARQWRGFDGGDVEPMLQVQTQVWLRELRRMVCRVDQEHRELVHADDVQDASEHLYLPLIHCRSCLATGWVTTCASHERTASRGLQTIYQQWFQHSTDAKLLYPLDPKDAQNGKFHQNRPDIRYLCPDCGELCLKNTHECGGTDKSAQLVAVWMPDITQKRANGRVARGDRCPHCQQENSLFIIGSRAASIASVAISRLFGSNYTEDRKLIAFSDSVQDAAHRAGFFGARTYTHALRLAFEQVLVHDPDIQTLEDFAGQCTHFWRSWRDDAWFAATFIPPNMEYWGAYLDLKQDGVLPQRGRLADNVGKRLRWEALMEFGPRARIGRSLQRQTIATIGVDAQDISDVAQAIHTDLVEHIEALRGVRVAELKTFVRGALTHWAAAGAWSVEEMRSLIGFKGQRFPWQGKKFPYLPGYGGSTQPPAALALQYPAHTYPSPLEVLTVRSQNSQLWISDWFRRTLAKDRPLFDGYFNDVMLAVVDALQAAGIFVPVQKTARRSDYYLLATDRWRIARNLTEMACEHCGRREIVPTIDAVHWFDTPCLSHGCVGRLQVQTQHPPKDEGTVPEPARVVAHEHTGLLAADAREAVENSFKTGQAPWDINVLSATSTLEMGIDIGDLSSVMLCSVPPNQANYLQRIGRAGRRDGNALTVVIANARPHDNYYYADPQLMMAGEVHTPGVFLDATAVLERQLTAYCFDQWVASGVADDAVPAKMKAVLSAVKKKDRAAFPYPFMNWVEAHEDRILHGFFRVFHALSDDGRTHLEAFLRGGQQEGSLCWRIDERLHRVLNLRESYVERCKENRRELRKLEKQPEDEATNAEIEEIRAENLGLKALQKSVNARQTLNFFTDEGLLPNYAFPEEGVTLDSVILRERRRSERAGKDQKNASRTATSLSFQRSSAAALGELAPKSTFYAAAHKLDIEQVDLKVSTPEMWRFCSECPYAEHLEATGDPHTECPRCGSAQWADVGQKRQVLRLRQVYAYADGQKDRIDDGQDGRAPSFYIRQLLVDIPPDSPRMSWKIDDDTFPFGFEYLAQVHFKEVNFGPPGNDKAELMVAGQEMGREGFKICKHCGFVHRDALEKKYRGKFRREHSRSCRVVRERRAATEDDWLDSLYLYRELTSESLRILLPLADVDGSSIDEQSFIAAIQLGLRKYFRGNVQHLEMTTMKEAGAGGQDRKYLLIYDRIPGGTGYLKELLRDPKKLFSVFEQALEVLNNCTCREMDDLDACHRCLLAYRQAKYYDSISNARAAHLLEELLKRQDKVVKTPSLSTINVSSLLESRFEERLVDAIGEHFTLRKMRIDDVSSWRIYVRDGRHCVWDLVPQHPVSDSVSGEIVTRPDLMLRLVSADDVVLPERFDTFVFADGYAFHHDRVAEDVRKRAQLLAENKRMWTLSWGELPTEDEGANSNDRMLFTHQGELPHSKIVAFLAHQGTRFAGARETTQRGSFQWLLDWIRDPEQTEKALQQAAIRQIMGRLYAEADDPAKLTDEAAQWVAPAVIEWAEDAEKMLWGGDFESLREHNNAHNPTQGDACTPVRWLAALPRAAIADAQQWEQEASAALWIDAEAIADNPPNKTWWEAFWVALNLLQFAPNIAVTTAQALEQHRADSPWVDWPDRAATQAESARDPIEEEQPWADVFHPEYGSELGHDQLRELMDAGLAEPEVGGDMMVGDENGGSAELVWQKAKVAVDRGEFGPVQGWVCIRADRDGWVTRVIEQFKRENDDA